MIDDLEELYRTRRPQFCRAAAAIAGDRGLGEDAVQDAFAKAVRKRRRYRGRGSLEAWVWRIVVNAACDARRTQRPLHGLRDRPEQATPDGRDGSIPLELLTERQREVLFFTTTQIWTTRRSPMRSESVPARSARRSPPPAACCGRRSYRR